MNLILDKRVGKDITSTEYYIAVRFPEDDENGHTYDIHYVHHNGYIRIEAPMPERDKFTEWFNTFNTRWQNTKRYGRWRRKKRITDWAFQTLELAYATYLTEVKIAHKKGKEL